MRWAYISSDSEPQLVEDAVKYIIFLVDAEKLFDTALGMYDFSLVLMIAQHSQKVVFSWKCTNSTLTIILGSSRISAIPSWTQSTTQVLPAI